MFTGLIEEVGQVLWIRASDGSTQLELAAPRIARKVRTGDSVAVNGCCLTVTAHRGEQLTFDLLQETLDRTNLKTLRRESAVNLERALSADGRIGGHFVQGHIDGTAKLLDKCMEPECRLRLENPTALARYVVQKGSVSVDGVSLTVAAIGGEWFEVALIPTTMARTELANRAIGWPFNIETDVLSKTIISWLERQQK